MTNQIPRHPSDQREQPGPAPNAEPPMAAGTPDFDDCRRVYRFDHRRREHAWGVLALAVLLVLAFIWIKPHTFSAYAWFGWAVVGLLVLAAPFLFRVRDEDIIGIHTDGLLWRPWLSQRRFVRWHRVAGIDEMVVWFRPRNRPFEEMHQLDVLEETADGARRLRRMTLIDPCEQADERLRALEQLRDEIVARARLIDIGYQDAVAGTEWGRENAHIRRLFEVNFRRIGRNASWDMRVRSWRRRTDA